MTIGKWLKDATQRLADRGVESPHLSALLILEEVSGFPRSHVLAFPEKEIPETLLDSAEALLARRLEHEPMAYILGRREFRNRTIRITPSVLVPRPESERLVDLAWQIAPKARYILDAGTGSGCLALSLAEKFPESCIFACDRFRPALDVAVSNDTSLRIRWFLSDWLECIGNTCLDLIVSNPPYLTSREVEIAEIQVRDWEPRSALDGGPEGLEGYRRLVPQAQRCLKTGGHLLMETSPTVAEAVLDLLDSWGFDAIRLEKDLGGLARYIHAKSL